MAARKDRVTEYTVTIRQEREFTLTVEARDAATAELLGHEALGKFERVSDRALDAYPVCDDMSEEWSVSVEED